MQVTEKQNHINNIPIHNRILFARVNEYQTTALLVMLRKNLARSKDKGPNLVTTCDLMLNGM